MVKVRVVELVKFFALEQGDKSTPHDIQSDDEELWAICQKEIEYFWSHISLWLRSIIMLMNRELLNKVAAACYKGNKFSTPSESIAQNKVSVKLMEFSVEKNFASSSI